MRWTQFFNLAENPNEFLPQHHRSNPMETDLADDPKYADQRRELEALLLREMERLDDPYPLWDQAKGH